MSSKTVDRLAQAVLALLLLPSCAVVLPINAGIDAGANGRVGATADISLQADFTTARLGPVMRLRAGHKFADMGFGWDTCGRPFPYRWAICGRLMALEFGHFEGEFEVGALSPSVGIQLWNASGTSYRLLKSTHWGIGVDANATNLWEARLSIGLDVRPMNQWAGTTPYLSLTFGRATHNRREPREPTPPPESEPFDAPFKPPNPPGDERSDGTKPE